MPAYGAGWNMKMKNTPSHEMSLANVLMAAFYQKPGISRAGSACSPKQRCGNAGGLRDSPQPPAMNTQWPFAHVGLSFTAHAYPVKTPKTPDVSKTVLFYARSRS